MVVEAIQLAGNSYIVGANVKANALIREGDHLRSGGGGLRLCVRLNVGFGRHNALLQSVVLLLSKDALRH